MELAGAMEREEDFSTEFKVDGERRYLYWQRAALQ